MTLKEQKATNSRYMMIKPKSDFDVVIILRDAIGSLFLSKKKKDPHAWDARTSSGDGTTCSTY